MRRDAELDAHIALFAARMDLGGIRARDGSWAAESAMSKIMQNLVVMGLFSGWRIAGSDPDFIRVEVNYGFAVVHVHEFPFVLLTPENAVAMEVMCS